MYTWIQTIFVRGRVKLETIGAFDSLDEALQSVRETWWEDERPSTATIFKLATPVATVIADDHGGDITITMADGTTERVSMPVAYA